MSSLIDHAPALVDALSEDGTIESCEVFQATMLGFRPEDVIGGPWEKIYSPSSLRQIESFFANPQRGPIAMRLHLMDSESRLLKVQAIADFGSTKSGELLLRLFKWGEAPLLESALRRQEDLAILADIVANSDDPIWCVEFDEPIDLSAPDHAIMQQVFSNRSNLRFCNSAMGRYYRFPKNEDMNNKPWSKIFPRNPSNERFILDLIRCNFNAKRIISVDMRYDGVSVAVENDICSDIRGNLLYRLWGTVRDVTRHQHNTATLRKQVSNLEELLTATPDPLLVVGESAVIFHANAATEDLLGLTADRILDHLYDDLIGPEAAWAVLQELLNDSMTQRLPSPIETKMFGRDGTISVAVNASRLESGGNSCVIVSLRRVIKRERWLDKSITQTSLQAE